MVGQIQVSVSSKFGYVTLEEITDRRIICSVIDAFFDASDELLFIEVYPNLSMDKLEVVVNKLGIFPCEKSSVKLTKCKIRVKKG